MSRIGKLPIKVPNGVTVNIANAIVSVSGPKGNLSQTIVPGVHIKQESNNLIVERTGNEARTRAEHGLMRALLQNMIIGVSEGYSKRLEINGVGFRVNLAGEELVFNLGFSHDVKYALPEGITAAVDQNVITISGADKQQVGQIAAEIRALKKPEPYKGKGLSYEDEHIIRKSGKTGKEKTE